MKFEEMNEVVWLNGGEYFWDILEESKRTKKALGCSEHRM